MIKNLNILRTKRAFEVKSKAFFIIFKWFSVAKNCRRPESASLKLTRLLRLISPYLAKFMKRNKSNTVFLGEIVIIFSPIYLSEATYVISLFNLMTEL